MTDLEAAVKLLGGDTNKVIYDDVGLPSIMVYFPKKTINEVYKSLTATSACPAFIVNGNEVNGFYISKYQNVVINGRAYSLPLQTPKSNLTYDEAITYSSNKGKGWHLYTNIERAYIAELCNTNGFIPGGNSKNGSNGLKNYEKAVPATYNNDGSIYAVLTGSGPKSWAHNNTASGVWDLVGNLSELVAGLRFVNGEIQVIADNDAANSDVSLASTSLNWKAINSTGLVEPGTKDTYKYDYIDSKITLNTTITNLTDSFISGYYKDVKIADGLVIPNIVYMLGLMPLKNVTYTYNGGFSLFLNKKELLPTAGGNFVRGSKAGINELYCNYDRTISGPGEGFRACYVDL